MKSLRLLYLAMGAATACLSPFLPVILQQRGLSPAAIGSVAAVGAGALIVAIGVWGHLGDRVLGRRATLQLCAASAIVFGVALGWPGFGALVAVLVVAFICTQGELLALADSVTVNEIADPAREYGRVRMMASLSFAVAAVCVGFVYDRLGYSTASVLYAAFAVVLIATAAIAPGANRSGAGIGEVSSIPTSRRSRFGSTGDAFAFQPRLVAVLATVAVTWLSVTVSFTFLSLRLVDLGGGPSDVALSVGVSAFAEIPGMVLATHLARRIGLGGLYAASSAVYGLTFLTWMVLTVPGLIVATRILTGLTYGGLTVAMVLTIRELLPDHLQATGQSLYQGTATGLAAVIGNFLGGIVYGSAGPAVLFGLSAALCGASSLMSLVTFPGQSKEGAATSPAADTAAGVDVESAVSP